MSGYHNQKLSLEACNGSLLGTHEANNNRLQDRYQSTWFGV